MADPNGYFDTGFDGSVLSRLVARKAQDKKGSNSNPNGDKIRRLSSWAKVSAGGLTLSTRNDTFESTYPGDKKPTPTLTKVIIRRSGMETHTVNLSLQVEFEFEVFTKDDFEKYASVFLRLYGATDLSVKWGNVDTYDGKGKINHELPGGLNILPGVWNATEYNSYICKGKAICDGVTGAAERITTTIVESDKVSNANAHAELSYNVRGYISKAIAEGTSRMGADVDNMGPDHGALHPGSIKGGDGGPKPKHICATWDAGWINKSEGSNAKTILGKSSAKDMDLNLYTYIPFDAIVHWMNIILEQREGADMKGILPKVRFQYSRDHYSYIPTALSSGGLFRSANPWKMLWFNGEVGDKGSACYMQTKTGNNGVDFGSKIPRNGSLSPNPVNGTYKAYSSGDKKFDFSKIWLNAHFLQDLLDRVIAGDKSVFLDSAAGKPGWESLSKTANLNAFLQAIFLEIKSCSGGYIDLTAVLEDVNGPTGGIPSPSVIKVYDKKYRILRSAGGSDPWLIESREGDGNLLEFKMIGDLSGADTATLYTYVNGENATGLAQEGMSINPTAFNEKVKALGEVWAKFGRTGINQETITEAQQTLQDVHGTEPYITSGGGNDKYKNTKEVPLYLTADLKMEGIFPIYGGNRFRVTSAPDWFNDNSNLCFRALEVIDQIDKPNDWTTSVSLIMSPL